MDEKQQQMLEETYRLAQENNAMLRKLIWAGRRAWIIQLIKVAAIIFITILVYFIIQPYLSTLTSLYSGQDINKILDAYNETQK
jgi:preprotein translocase subunit SecE